MATLPETPVYPSGIYQYNTTDPIQGGTPQFDADGNPVAGWDNVQAKQLADRTRYLKQAHEDLTDGDNKLRGERLPSTAAKSDMSNVDPDVLKGKLGLGPLILSGELGAWISPGVILTGNPV
ncbi:MAG: hypothetical protein SFY80_03135 [Verrucomicrobiota bacterium]|nr:hypothetical protein [Verrucomicrobiota bacterium]